MSSKFDHLKVSVLAQLPGAPSIGLQNLGSMRAQVLATENSVHARRSPEHGVKDEKVTRAVFEPLEANNCDGVAGLLKIDGRQVSSVHFDIVVIVGCCHKVRLDIAQQLFVCLAAVVAVCKHLKAMIDTETPQQGFDLGHVSKSLGER